MIKIIFKSRALFFLFLIGFCSKSLADSQYCYVWTDPEFSTLNTPSCGTLLERQYDLAVYLNRLLGKDFTPDTIDIVSFDSGYPGHMGALVNVRSGDDVRTAVTALVSPQCSGSVNSAGECSTQFVARKEKGVDRIPLICSVSVYKGDPINSAVGNEFETEDDYAASTGTLGFIRYYNSLDGLWTHSYSQHLLFADGGVFLSTEDGQQSYFTLTNNVATPEATEMGSLTLSGDSWIYSSAKNETLTFNGSGQLTAWKNLAGDSLSLTYSDSSVTITDSFNHSLTFSEDINHQPLSMSAPGLAVNYTYNTNGHLASVTRTHGTQSESRTYLYENADPKLLTGIIDERGVRDATWTYDSQGRATSSEHAGGIGKVILAYSDDGSSTTVTNELGKQTVYQYQTIQSVKRITAIQGEPSPNCPASNSTYAYNPAGQVLTKTDAKGFITQYTYNDRGLETQRVEGSGSTQPRTITTEWDPSRFLRTKVAGPTHTTVYTYDAQGRQLTQVTTSNSSK